MGWSWNHRFENAAQRLTSLSTHMQMLEMCEADEGAA
jgi:hypothetical protein